MFVVFCSSPATTTTIVTCSTTATGTAYPTQQTGYAVATAAAPAAAATYGTAAAAAARPTGYDQAYQTAATPGTYASEYDFFFFIHSSMAVLDFKGEKFHQIYDFPFFSHFVSNNTRCAGGEVIALLVNAIWLISALVQQPLTPSPHFPHPASSSVSPVWGVSPASKNPYHEEGCNVHSA